MRFTSLLVSALLVIASGCVGDVYDPGTNPMPGTDAGPSGGGEAKTLYTTTVHPVQLAKCGQPACHGQPGVTGVYGYVTMDADTSYSQITNLPTVVGTYTTASAGILTKIKQAGGHNAATYTADEEAKIAAWLAKEAQERNNGMGPPPVDPIAKLGEWTGCMSLENFEAAGMPAAWGQLATVFNQRCANCHGQGLDSFLSGTGQAEPYFLGVSTNKDFLIKYFTVDASGAIIINTAAMQNAGVTLPNHPRFNAMDNAGMTALNEFYMLTKTRQMTQTPPCGPSTLMMTP